jgi:hypothetical protein
LVISARERNELPLAAGKLSRDAIGERRHVHLVQHLSRALTPLGLRHCRHFEIERDIIEAGEMRKQRVVLEHHRGAATNRRPADDIFAIDPHLARDF